MPDANGVFGSVPTFLRRRKAAPPEAAPEAPTARQVLLGLAELVVLFAEIRKDGVRHPRFPRLLPLLTFLKGHEALWPAGIPADAVERFLSGVGRCELDTPFARVDTTPLAVLMDGEEPRAGTSDDALLAALADFFAATAAADPRPATG